MQKNKNITQIQYLYWGIFAVLILLALTASAIVTKNGALVVWTLQDIETLKSVIILLALGGIPAGFIFHTKKIKKIEPSLPIEQKLNQYRSSFFIKIVTFEGLGILSLIGYLVSADKTFLMIFGLLFVAYLLNIPVEHKILDEIGHDNTIEENE
jgi:hypothetical protein